MTRTDLPATFDQRTMLTTLLDYVRATVHAKCVDLANADAGRAPLSTSPLTSISGLVSHLRWVEIDWFERVFLGLEDRGPWTKEDPDREMRIGPDIPIEQLLAEYEETCAHHRSLVAEHDLDEAAAHKTGSGATITLGWILLHLIEETARHNGHIDILREMADGTTGQ